MAPITADDTVKFLIACITCKEGDKIDFEKVAAECEIVSKAAAAKRYERIIKKAKEDDEKQKAVKAAIDEAIANGEEPPAPEETPKKKPAAPRTPKTPKTPKPKAVPKEKKETAASAKKRKLAEVKKEEEDAAENEDAAMEDAGGEKPSIFGRPEDDVKVEV